MSKTADIGSKRLISLAPATWVRWVTGDPTAEALDFLSGEFEWVSRATDELIADERLSELEPLLAFFAAFVSRACSGQK